MCIRDSIGAVHALQTDGQTPKAITLTWDGKAWQKPITGLPIILTVSCQKQPVSPLPTAPTKAETLQLLGAARVQVNCSAGRHGARAYVLREDSIQLSSVYEVNNQPDVYKRQAPGAVQAISCGVCFLSGHI